MTMLLSTTTPFFLTKYIWPCRKHIIEKGIIQHWFQGLIYSFGDWHTRYFQIEHKQKRGRGPKARISVVSRTNEPWHNIIDLKLFILSPKMGMDYAPITSFFSNLKSDQQTSFQDGHPSLFPFVLNSDNLCVNLHYCSALTEK